MIKFKLPLEWKWFETRVICLGWLPLVWNHCVPPTGQFWRRAYNSDIAQILYLQKHEVEKDRIFYFAFKYWIHPKNIILCYTAKQLVNYLQIIDIFLISTTILIEIPSGLFIGAPRDKPFCSVALPLPKPLTPTGECVQRCFIVCVPKVIKPTKKLFQFVHKCIVQINFILISGITSKTPFRYI